MKKIVQNQFYQNLITMIDWTFEIQKENKFQDLSKIAYAREMSTIKFCLPRQSGHSFMVRRIINENKYKPIILFPYQSINYLNKSLYSGTPDYLEKFCGMNTNLVILEVASIWSANQIKKFMSFLQNGIIQ